MKIIVLSNALIYHRYSQRTRYILGKTNSASPCQFPENSTGLQCRSGFKEGYAVPAAQNLQHRIKINKIWARDK
jgi:hypothetical protein